MANHKYERFPFGRFEIENHTDGTANVWFHPEDEQNDSSTYVSVSEADTRKMDWGRKAGLEALMLYMGAEED